MLCATVTFVAIRSQLWGMTPSRLQTFLRYRVVKFALSGAVLLGIGLGIYTLEVSVIGWDKLYVRPANWVLMTFIGYIANWLIFHEREAPKALSGVKFYAVAVLCSAASNSLFFWLNYRLGIYYLLAQLIAAPAVGVPHFVVLDRRVFTRAKSKTA
jgi:putative flippase GtrA